jgi:hypothetical protein
MSRHGNLPYHFYVKVNNVFLGPDMPSGFTEAIWHGVYGRPNQVLMAHVLLESGAHWSGLPIHALSATDNFDYSYNQLMPWTVMGENIDLFHANYLEGLACKINKPFAANARHTGIIIDWRDGFSRYPAEHKPLNLLQVENGQFALLPNNFILMSDNHFVNENSRQYLKYYRRGETIFWE